MRKETRNYTANVWLRLQTLAEIHRIYEMNAMNPPNTMSGLISEILEVFLISLRKKDLKKEEPMTLPQSISYLRSRGFSLRNPSPIRDGLLEIIDTDRLADEAGFSYDDLQEVLRIYKDNV